MQSVRYSAQPRLKFEVALIDMIKMDSTIEISTLLSGMGQGGPHIPQARRQPAQAAVTQDIAAEPRAPMQTLAVQAAGTSTTDAKKHLFAAETAYKQALNIPPPAAAQPYTTKTTSPVSLPPESPALPDAGQGNPAPPIVQMLVDRFDAVILRST
jgi:hypothetical protein